MLFSTPKGLSDWLSSRDVILVSIMVFEPTKFEPRFRFVLDIIDCEAQTKSSEEWSKINNVIVVDPDGWDRSSWQYSWFDEKITFNEFGRRLTKSTIQLPIGYQYD